jgi:hypothetical protein
MEANHGFLTTCMQTMQVRTQSDRYVLFIINYAEKSVRTFGTQSAHKNIKHK